MVEPATVVVPPPHTLLDKWLNIWTLPGTTRIRPPYDDVLDVFRAVIVVIPIDEGWYLAEYPAVARHLATSQDKTASAHFRMHGYFDGRDPFPEGWHGLERPLRFAEVRKSLHVVVGRGKLFANLERDEFVGLIQRILRMVPVDESWYRETYPSAAEELSLGRSRSAAEHYVTRGYFQGLLPANVEVDEDWYLTRYDHARNGVTAGVARSAKDHFMRIGYGEGCQPTRY